MSAGGFDHSTMAQAFEHPGADTRHWTSHAIVDRETAEQKSVEFTKEYGPLVSCTLQPSGIPVRARVAGAVAGNGEADWFPFLEGDEVQVAINEGHEGSCVIIGRLNQEIDAFPTSVAGTDVTQNNVAFRRVRTPYIFETAAAYLVRNAATGSYLAMDATGSVQLVNGDKAFLALTPHLIGIQTGDGKALIQIDVEKLQVNIEANGFKATLDAKRSIITSAGTIEIAGKGNQAGEHATSIEAIAGLLDIILKAAAAAATAPPALVSFFASFSAPATLAALLTGAAALPVDPALRAAIATGLLLPKNPAAGLAGLGAPGVLIG